MNDGTIDLPDLEQDALTEIVNIGMGRAAKSLSVMIKEPVQLSVPKIEVLNRGRVADVLSRRERSGLVSVKQDFRGAFSGEAMLIFPETNSLELVRAVLGEGMSLEEIVDLEQEALAEIGNIILNGCLVVVANLLHQGLTMSLPQVMRGSGSQILNGTDNAQSEEAVLFLTIDFAVRARNIKGYIALLMDLPSLTALKTLIREFIRGVEGGQVPP
ncbi:chemotaxis protein CheX [Indioceanicola profundi]|uniref:chemotaxis protein CheX n=1 Tax=Indioceanicola profundi TaxID=2220096 RepID=UPI000E6AC81C|nr:chemotaxis protein CheX [Indioceanicola profundi]